MILGVGTDIVHSERIEKALMNPRFLKRILTPSEQAIGLTTQQIAGRWAVKEAIAKALGASLKWHDVEVLNLPSGQPVAKIAHPLFHPQTQKIHISISHEKSVAVAVAIWEG